jgi:hypothetical protein
LGVLGLIYEQIQEVPRIPCKWERQMGVVQLDYRPVAVTVASSAGSHDAGIASLNAMTDWLTHHAHVAALPSRPRC